jgi:hypothetical protein
LAPKESKALVDMHKVFLVLKVLQVFKVLLALLELKEQQVLKA